MRMVKLLAMGGIVLAVSTVSSYAASMNTMSEMANGSAPAIEEVAGHACGPHAHYVRAHRARNGHFIKAHCVRDHH
jgi:hypothetical protein